MSGHMILLNLLGGAALLVWATHLVRGAVLSSFGAPLRRALAAASRGRLRSAAAGAGAAAALQSSTATALLLGGFIERGLVGLAPALAMLIGADLGTTLVVQALSFDLRALAPAFLAAGVFLALGGRSERLRDIGRIALGFGLLTLAIGLIVSASAPLRESDVTALALRRLAADPLLAVLAGAALTWLFHSSVAFVLFVAALAGAGVASPGLVLTLVLGANLGAGLVPLGLAAGASLEARRALFGNLGFRLIGVAALLPFVGWLGAHMDALAGDPARQAAQAHTLFNLGLAAVFLPLTGAAAALLVRLWPDPPASARGGDVEHLDADLLDRPALALNAATRALMRLADKVELMLRRTMLAFEGEAQERITELRALEAEVDDAQEAIKRYLTRLMQSGLDAGQSERVVELILFTTNLEHVGDIIDRGLLGMAEKKLRLGLAFSDPGWEDIRAYHARTAEQMRLALTVFVSRDLGLARDLVAEKDRLRGLEQAATERHFARLKAGKAESIETSALHLDVLRDLKRITAHLTTVAYPILEARGLLRGSRLEAAGLNPRDA